MYLIQNIQEATYKIERSEFIAYLVPVTTVEQAKENIAERSKKMYRATHNCWAYIVGEKGELSHCSDAGEPSGTAGLPILRTLQKYNLTNVATIVTRYFGGIKLGVRGLIDAYSETTRLAIEVSPLIKLVKTFSYFIEVEYSQLEPLKYHLNNLHAVITHADYSNKVVLSITIEEEFHENCINFLRKIEKAGSITVLSME